MALVQKETIPFAGCVTLLNKFNNEFAEIQAPQEIAGFFFVLRSLGDLPSVASAKVGWSTEVSAEHNLNIDYW